MSIALLVCSASWVHSAFAQEEEFYVEAGAYSILRDSIEQALALEAKNAKGNILDYTEVKQIAESVLNARWTALGGEMAQLFGSDERIGDAVEAREYLRRKIRGIEDSFSTRNTDVNRIRAEVNLYLVRVLDEGRDFTINDTAFNNPYSFYQALMGLSWTHPDSGNATPLFAAAVYVRTRVMDYRDGDFRRTSEVEGLDEEFFADILVDAQFLTSDGLAVPQVLGDSATVGGEGLIGNDQDIRSFLVQSVRSSKLSMALFFGSPPVFADQGYLGRI